MTSEPSAAAMYDSTYCSLVQRTVSLADGAFCLNLLIASRNVEAPGAGAKRFSAIDFFHAEFEESR